METTPPPSILSPNRISETTFRVKIESSVAWRLFELTLSKALIWSSAAIATPFVPFRLWARWTTFQKLFVDDGLVILAYLLLLAYAIAWQIYADDMYLVTDVGIGSKPVPPNIFDYIRRWAQAQVFHIFLSGFCLWSIKLAFLLFFRRLGERVRYHRILWRCVLAFNVATFAVWMGIVQWHCIINSPIGLFLTCNIPSAAYRSRVGLKIQTAMNILSDAAIITLPVHLLWNVQISLEKKLRLGGIFSLTAFIMITSVIRVIFVNSSMSFLDQSWFYTWSAIEMAVAVIVACIASFRALFTARGSSNRSPAKSPGISDPESLPLRRLDKRPASSPVSNRLGPEHGDAQESTLSESQGKLQALVQTRSTTAAGSETPLPERGGELSRKSSDDDSMRLRDDRGTVRNEYSVFPSTGFQ